MRAVRNKKSVNHKYLSNSFIDDRIIVSPADSCFKWKCPIDNEDEITVKYTHKYKIIDLLDGSPYQVCFKGGLFMHSFLGPYDYHRFRAPVRGTVLECRAIQQDVYLDVRIKDGKFEALMEYNSIWKEEERGIWLRKKGIKKAHLDKWKKELSEVLKKQKSDVKEKKIIKALEKELQNKDKALAEVTELLVMKKKADAIWGNGEEES